MGCGRRGRPPWVSLPAAGPGFLPGGPGAAEDAMTDPNGTARPLPLHWRLLEAYFHRVYHMETLENDPGALLAYNFFTYRGPDVPLSDGATVRAGDRVMELHFRREALLPLIQDGDPRRVGLALLKLGDRDIPRLARALRDDPALRDVRALHALTLFHRGIGRWGFEVRPVDEPLAERWFTWWHRLLMARDHPQGGAHIRQHQAKLVTRHVWASREALIRRYAADAAPGPPSRGPSGR
jgi:hypothetical protein